MFIYKNRYIKIEISIQIKDLNWFIGKNLSYHIQFLYVAINQTLALSAEMNYKCIMTSKVKICCLIQIMAYFLNTHCTNKSPNFAQIHIRQLFDGTISTIFFVFNF